MTGLIILVGVVSAVVVILAFIGYGLVRRRVSRALGRATGDLVGDSEDATPAVTGHTRGSLAVGSPMTRVRILGVAATAALGVAAMAACTPAKPVPHGVVPFECTGAAQSFVVPNGVTAIVADAYGAAGGDETGTDNAGGFGGRAASVVPVTPGEILTVEVGCAGSNIPGMGAPGGYPDGGGGGNGGTGGASGGGSSSVHRSGSRVVVAGGGGGAGGFLGDNDGGAGGGTTGGIGTDGNPVTCGGGGTQTAGGAGATGIMDDTPGEAGDTDGPGAGGDGGNDNEGGPGGGGGWHGGGGAAGRDVGGTGGGGGGSGFTPDGAGMENGVRAGDGQVVISY